LALSGLGDRVNILRCEISRLPLTASEDGAANWGSVETFDGALANFGVLNCLTATALAQIGRGLGDRLRPGARFIAVVMGPCCAWEVGWYILRGDFRRASRRWWRGGAVAELSAGELRVRYPSVSALLAALAPPFRLVYAAAIGSVLPPTYAGGWLARRPRLLARLAALDRRVERWPLAVRCADHYLACFERSDDG